MGDVVVFRRRMVAPAEEESPEIDLLTALDVAIRDLGDISDHLTNDAARNQAFECRAMLERAFAAALQQA